MKLKMFEDKQRQDLSNKYFSPSVDSSSFSSAHSDTSWSSNCSCQIRSKISANSLNIENLQKRLEIGLVKFEEKLVNIETTIRGTKADVSQPPPQTSSSNTPQSAPTTNPPAPTPPTFTNMSSQSSQARLNSPLELSGVAPTVDPLQGFVFSASSPTTNLN